MHTLSAAKEYIRLVLVALAITQSTAVVAEGRLDPLNASELARAMHLHRSSAAPGQQLSTPGSEAAASRRADQSSPAVSPESIADNQELLLVERSHLNKNDNGRKADVYVYDYESNELIHSVIDLRSERVISTSRSQDVQLPLTAAEIERATDLVFGEEEQSRLLKDEYRRIVGQELLDPSQLNIKAFTFRADSMPQQVNRASSACGIHRCALLLLYTADQVVFEISPIVDLSTNIITQNIGF